MKPIKKEWLENALSFAFDFKKLNASQMNVLEWLAGDLASGILNMLH